MTLNVFARAWVSPTYLLWGGVHVFCPLFKITLFSYCWLLRVLYMFWIQVLCHIICLESIFSLPAICLFMFLKVSSYEQKLWILIQANLPIFNFSLGAFYDLLKKSLPTSTSQSDIPMFCFKSFMLLGFTFRPVIHLPFYSCVYAR